MIRAMRGMRIVRKDSRLPELKSMEEVRLRCGHLQAARQSPPAL